MAPRRSVKISSSEKSDKPGTKKLSGRLRKKTQPLKLPNTLTISIPSSIDVPDTAKKLDKTTKIALANEARAQLLQTPIEARPEPPKQRGRPKNIVVSNFFKNADGNTATGKINSSVQKNIKKPPVKKPPEKRAVPTRKRVADSTVKKPVIKRRKVIKDVSNTETKQEKETVKNEAVKPDTTAKETVENKSNECPNLFSQPTVIKRRNLSLKGKKNKVEIRQTSPILQTRSVNRSNEPIKKTQNSDEQKSHSDKSVKNIVVNAGPIDSRKTSVSSASNLSWTRDISSSSTTSVIVSTNDFVRFNKKLPVIKLTNIDSEVNKYKAKSTVDDEDSSSDDSTESETSYDKSVNLRSPLHTGLVNTIHLSSSNSTSTELTKSDTNSNYNKKDFGKAAENLMHVMKKIDMEFINWIHETDYVTRDLNQYKDKLFDILKSEFCAIFHCRQLQEISTSKNASTCNVETRNGSKTDTQSKESVEYNKIETNKHNTVVHNSVGSNNSNANEHNKASASRNESVDRNKIENNKNITAKFNNTINRLDSTKGNIDKQITSENNNHETSCSIALYKIKDTIENNRDIVNKFKNNRDMKNNTFENIRVKIDRIGTKKVEYNPIESNAVEYNSVEANAAEINKVNNNCVETSKVDDLRHYSAQNKPEEEMTRPSTSGITSNKLNDSNSSDSSSDTSDSESSSDSKESVEEKYLDPNPHDDDDALSLFAESLTGMESSKINISVKSTPGKPVEEYIPKPVQEKIVLPNNYTYCPTKISEQEKNIKPVCEKQNADSTSIYKEKEANNDTPVCHSPINSPNEKRATENHFEFNTPNGFKPRLIEHFVQTKPGDFNTLFKGYCLHNLMYKCPFAMCSHLCRYSHEVPSDQEIKLKMARMDQEMFTKEYMLVRRRPIMLRRFGLSFLYECMKRRYTRTLIEMSFDFLTRLPTGTEICETLKVAGVEITLLHLNHVDLSVCEDLLLLRVNENSLLCDVFMQIMACTQNFSRFKPVFLTLTYFLVNNDRTFSLEVTKNLLERVCILPFNEPVVRALIQIMRLTSAEIFQNSMLEKFEQQLSVNRNVAEEYWSLKNEFDVANRVPVNQPLVQMVDQMPIMQTMDQPRMFSPVDQPRLFSPVDTQQPRLFSPPLMTPLRVQTMEQPPARPEGVPLPPSPDTTHLDNMNKTTESTVVPKITRTIFGLNSGPTHTPISHSSSNREDMNVTPGHENWKHRSIFQQIQRASYTPGESMRPPMRFSRPQMRKRPFGGHRLVTIGGSPVMFPPPRPEF